MSSPDGYYLDFEGGIDVSQCKACPVGLYLDAAANREMQEDCISCGKGKYSNEVGQDSEADCRLCAPGQHNDWNSSWDGKNYFQRHAACKACPAGKYADNFEMHFCKNCLPGRYTHLQGQDSVGNCTLCPSGRWGRKEGADNERHCIRCRVGLFGNASGLTSSEIACHSCKAGEEAGYLNLDDGLWMKDRLAGAQGCAPCSKGFFLSQRHRESDAAMFCLLCEGSNSTGLDYCPGCPSGQFGYENTENAPIPCTPCKLTLITL